jgi:hypothetical protein
MPQTLVLRGICTSQGATRTFFGNGRGMLANGAPKWKCWMRLPVDTQHPSPPTEIS